MFKAQAHGFWPHLQAVIQAGADVAILGAQDQTTFPIAKRPRAARMGARVHEREGGHMLPVEQPNLTANWLSAELSGKASPTRV